MDRQTSYKTIAVAATLPPILQSYKTHIPAQSAFDPPTWNKLKAVTEVTKLSSLTTAPRPVSGRISGNAANAGLVALMMVTFQNKSGPLT